MNEICKNCKIKSSATKELNTKELERLENNCVEVNFKKGDIIFKQGALSSNIIYLKHGLVKMHITGPYYEQIIRITKAPSYLGVPTTFGNKINQYSVTAIEDTNVCFIDIKTFTYFISKNGKFASKIILELCRNEISSYNRCVNRIQKQINGRVAEALLFLYNNVYNSKDFILPITRSEFGNLIDTSRESVSRILSQFNNDNIIELNGKKIKILNKKFLEIISKNG